MHCRRVQVDLQVYRPTGPPGLAGGREATGAGQAAVSVSVRRIRGAWIEVLTLGGDKGPSRSHVAPVHAFSVMSLFAYSCSSGLHSACYTLSDRLWQPRVQVDLSSPLRLPVNSPYCPGTASEQSNSAINTCQLHQLADSGHAYIVRPHMGFECCCKQQTSHTVQGWCQLGEGSTCASGRGT